MSPRLYILAIAVLLPAIESAAVFPKSCLQAKQYQLTDEDRNGYFLLYDDLQRPFTSYCDFKSDPGFVWTLVESLSLTNGKSSKYKKSFNHDAPSPQCTPNWLEYRLSVSRMKSIKNTPGSTHYRATCNFKAESENGGIDHRDYLRVSFCHDGRFFSGTGRNHCVKIEYVNIRGHTCRQCNIPIHNGNSGAHMFIQVHKIDKMCDKWIVPNTHVEDVFGHYATVDARFSCSNSSTSTTNWWIGGYY